MGQINTHRKWNWYWFGVTQNRETICIWNRILNFTFPKGDSNYVDWKGMFVSESVPHVQRIPYWGSSSKVSKLYIKGHFICIWDMVKILYCLLRKKMCCGAWLIDWLILVHAMEWKKLWIRQSSLLQIIYLSFRSCDSCRRLPEPKHHSFLFNYYRLW